MSDEQERRISQLESDLAKERQVVKAATEAWHELFGEILRINERKEMRLFEMVKLVVHAAIVIALITAYTVVTVTGTDGTAILGLLGGYLGGATVERVSNKQRRT